jgi:hypothetical protein
VPGGISSTTIQAILKTVHLMLGEFWNKVLALLVSSSSSHFLWFMHQASKSINHHGIKLKQWDLALAQAKFFVDISTNWVISSTLNLVDIIEYFPQETFDYNLRMSYIQEEEFDVGQHLPTSVINPNVRKKSTMVWKLIRMIKILQWKYRRKSTKGKNIFILSRFHDRINNPLSKREDKSKRKELEENEGKLKNSRRSVLTVRSSVWNSFERELFTDTVHRHYSSGTVHLRKHCSPEDSSTQRTLPLGAPFDPGITYTRYFYLS